MENLRAKYADARNLQLHLGGWEARPGWTIVNAEDRPGVDVLGNCMDLSMFPDGSASEVYASHVYEHLGYQKELPLALTEAHRVLAPGGRLRVSVPDLEVLCRLFLQTAQDVESQFFVQRMIMGGQMEPLDFHKTGFSHRILAAFLTGQGFVDIRRVQNFGLFNDTSAMLWGGVPISLNVECVRGPGPRPAPVG